MGLFRIFLFILKAVVAQNWWCGQGALQLGHMSDDSLVIVEAWPHVYTRVLRQINRVELLVVAKSRAFVLEEVVSE